MNVLHLPQLIRHSLLCIGLFVFSIGAGLGLNLLRSDPLPLLYEPPTLGFQRLDDGQNWEPGISVVDAKITERLVTNRAALVLDARNDLFYEFGHIQGAENLALKNFDHDYARLETLLAEAKSAEIPILVYCSHQHCEDASKLATRLQENNFPTILVYEAGYDEWDRLGLPIETSK